MNTIPYVRYLTKKTAKPASGVAMSVEETKLMRIVKDQFARKGGFVRIFPAVDTWKKYSKYLGMIIPVKIKCRTKFDAQSEVVSVTAHRILLRSQNRSMTT